jgi:hypothetical protein
MLYDESLGTRGYENGSDGKDVYDVFREIGHEAEARKDEWIWGRTAGKAFTDGDLVIVSVEGDELRFSSMEISTVW